jgi:glycosyltransferase involved in cell wall biosynthesis
MKILYLLDYPLSLQGGAQISTKIIGDRLKKKYGEDIFYLAPFDRKYMQEEENCYSYKTENGVLQNPRDNIIEFIRSYRKIREIVEFLDPNIIHSNMPISLIVNSLLPNKYYKIHTDRGLFHKYRNVTRFVDKLCLARIDMLLTTTEINRTAWKGFLNRESITVVPNLVDEIYEHYSEKERDDYRRQLGIENKVVLGFAGRMTKVKNWPMALKIIDYINGRFPDICFSVAISCYHNNQEESSLTDDFIRKCKEIAKGKIYVFKDLNNKQMADWYYLIDIFVLTSDFESFGRTAIEAMSRRCIVLGRNSGGIPEVIGNNSLLYNNYNDLILKLDGIISAKEDKMHVLKDGCYQNYLSRYNSDTILDKLHGLYFMALSK